MRKLKSTIVLTLFMSLFLLNSCSSNSDEAPAASTGDYWPTAIGNQWVLDQSGQSVTMKIISSDNDYFKFDQFSGVGDGVTGTGSVYLKKVKGDYSIKVDELKFNYAEGITGSSSGYEFIFFKDYLEVTKTWTGSFVQTTSFSLAGFPAIKSTVNYTGTILEKATSVVVNGVTYNDVIKFKFRQELKVEGQAATSSDAEYWLAKDIGVIKFVVGNTSSVLKSYVVKK
jgi:hypothetical protein